MNSRHVVIQLDLAVELNRLDRRCGVENADTARVGAVVKLVLAVGEVHETAHEVRLAVLDVVERNNARRRRSEHTVEVYADSNTLYSAHLLKGLVDVLPQLGKATVGGNIADNLPQGEHTLGLDVKLLEHVLHRCDAGHVVVYLTQAVDERPKRRTLLILLKPLYVAQIGELHDKLLHRVAQLRKAQKVLENIAAVAYDLGVVRDARHDFAYMVALVPLFCERVQQELDREVVDALGGQGLVALIRVLRKHQAVIHSSFLILSDF